MTKRFTKQHLEKVYAACNHRRLVHPDPLEFLYKCSVEDREIVAFLAAALAYGRVRQVLNSVEDLLSRLGTPRKTVLSSGTQRLKRRMSGFKHRFTKGEELVRLVCGMGEVIRVHGSLAACFAAHRKPEDLTILDALSEFVDELTDACGGEIPFLLPSPRDGSACKRLNLFLRWMVREDEVDPGGWERIPASALIIPLDTHMHRIGLAFGLTARKSADMKTALEITDGFRRYCPEDPVRYDFALTRPGILRNFATPTKRITS